MVRLASLTNPRLAQAFVDYMASRSIDIQIMPEGGGQFALWLSRSEDQVEAESELNQFLTNPHDTKYQAASWEMAESRTNHLQYQSPSMFAMIKAKAGPVTLMIMLISVVVFVLQQLGAFDLVFSALHFPAATNQGWQLWRWLSHAILHFSVMHIAFNLLWWWQFGGDIERRLGPGKLLQLFVVAAILSGAGQYWIEGANFGGLSGVVYALVGYLWMLSYKAPKVGLSIPKPLIGFMLVWLVLGFMQPFMAIANTAHLVGLLTGVAIGLIDAARYNAQPKRP